MKIGDKVYKFEPELRRRNSVGLVDPILNFIEYTVFAETSRSWLACPTGFAPSEKRATKLSKSGEWPMSFHATWQSFEDFVWMREHQWQIANQLKYANLDIAEIKKIAAMVGYKEKTPA